MEKLPSFTIDHFKTVYVSVGYHESSDLGCGSPNR